MERLGELEYARRKVLADIQQFLTTVHLLSSEPVTSSSSGIETLRRLRRESYEDLNQIQHENMILVAAEWLTSENRCPPGTEWFWNARQTGDFGEPDLRGVSDGRIAISAEITTSEVPKGLIDSRMRNTLAKLAHMEGQKYYFVSTESMYHRAKTKIAKAGWSIEVIHLTG